MLDDRTLALVATSAASAIGGATTERARTPDRVSADEVAESDRSHRRAGVSVVTASVAQNA
jgi:hypothetical protein